MLITRTSQLSGKTRTKDLPVTEEQLNDYYENGTLLQNAFPNLSPADREFIKTGITDDEWNSMFPEEEEEEEYDEPDVDWLQEQEDFEMADEYFGGDVEHL